jgi:hypothetical protein
MGGHGSLRPGGASASEGIDKGLRFSVNMEALLQGAVAQIPLVVAKSP